GSVAGRIFRNACAALVPVSVGGKYLGDKVNLGSAIVFVAAPSTGSLWVLTGILFLTVLGGAVVAMIAARRFFNGGSRATNHGAELNPRSDNPAAFMTASMQAVIQ